MLTKIIAKKMAMFPPEETIQAYYKRAVEDCPAYPMTINEVRKMYWKAIKLKKMVDFDEVYSKRLIKHLKYVKNKLKNNADFKSEIIGETSVKINKDGTGTLTIICDEHPDLIITTYNYSSEWLLNKIALYEKERCVNIVDNKVYTRLDISK